MQFKKTSQIGTQSLLDDDFAIRHLILDLLFCNNLEMLSLSVSDLVMSPLLGEVLISMRWEFQDMEIENK